MQIATLYSQVETIEQNINGAIYSLFKLTSEEVILLEAAVSKDDPP